VLGGQPLTRRPAAGQDLSTKFVNDPFIGERLPLLGHNLILQVGFTRPLPGQVAGQHQSGDASRPLRQGVSAPARNCPLALLLWI